MPKTVNVYEAKTHLSQLLAQAEAGEDIVIARQGRPVVRLVRVGRRGADRLPGALRGRIRMSDDFDGFDAADGADWYGSDA